MRLIFLIFTILCVLNQVESQLWNYPQQFLSSWLRQGKTGSENKVNSISSTTIRASTATATTTTKLPPNITENLLKSTTSTTSTTSKLTTTKINETKRTTNKINLTTTLKMPTKTSISGPTIRPNATTSTTPISTTIRNIISMQNLTSSATSGRTTSISTEPPSTLMDTTTHDVTATTEEPRDNHRTHDFYLSKREKPQVKIASNISQNLLPLPAGASAALVKPTKYHYYPHNQHIYLLPECAIQQVCNAVYVRLNWTQPLCACPSRYRDPCSASLNSDDQHTTELMTDRKSKRALTLVKTCEPTTEMRICRSPRDWSLLALQNIRTGKSHYLVICRCSDASILEGPMSHDQPTYASVPGIRVYGMMCVDGKRRGRPLRTSRSIENPSFPWDKVVELANTVIWD